MMHVVTKRYQFIYRVESIFISIFEILEISVKLSVDSSDTSLKTSTVALMKEIMTAIREKNKFDYRDISNLLALWKSRSSEILS